MILFIMHRATNMQILQKANKSLVYIKACSQLHIIQVSKDVVVVNAQSQVLAKIETTSWQLKADCMKEDYDGYHQRLSTLEPLPTQSKSCDHEIVRAQKKVSKFHPKTPPKPCSVVTDSKCQCEVTYDMVLFQIIFRGNSIHAGLHT